MRFYAYLFEHWIDFHQTNTEIIFGLFYTYRQIHFTSENVYFFRYLSPVASRALLPVCCLAAKVDLYRAKEVLHYVRPSLPCLRFTPSAFFYSRLKTPLFHKSFRSVFLVPFGLPSWILHLDRTYWALAFVCFSFIFFYTFGCVC